MEPATTAALISGGASLLGGVFGGKDKNDGFSRRGFYQMVKSNEKFGGRLLRAKVNSAKAAGLHPLFAMGAGLSSMSAPTVVGDTGSTNGNAIAELGRTAERWSEAKQLKLESEARIRESEARANLANTQANDIVFQQQEASKNKVLQQNTNAVQDTEAVTLVTPWGMHKTSNTSKQQDVEDEYGGAVGEVYGVSRAIQDAYDNSKIKKLLNKPLYYYKKTPSTYRRSNRVYYRSK